ncbi:MAG: hypothetical protein KUL86_06980 [Castellaniella sp.]|nr:hypothetical protein [Castellaniella sp.]
MRASDCPPFKPKFIIPAAPGFFVLHCHPTYRPASLRPDDVPCDPIIGWAIDEDGWQIPLTTSGPLDSYDALLRPDGQVEGAERTFRDVRAWLDFLGAGVPGAESFVS